jgi:hypothetical protein
MKDFNVIIIALFAVLISDFLGHIAAPFSILATPFIVGFVSWIIFNKSRLHILIKTLILISLIVINDILIRFYAGGTHDSEGNGWILLMFYIALIIAGISLLVYGIANKQFKWIIINLIISFLVFYFYLSNCYTLGMSWDNYPSENIIEAKKDNVFISELSFSDTLINSGNNTYQIIDGWIEKEINIDNTGFKKQISFTGKFNVILNTIGSFDKYEYSDNIQYRINDSTSLGSYAIKERITYKTDSNDTLIMYFYHNDKFIKKIFTFANTRYSQ